MTVSARKVSFSVGQLVEMCRRGDINFRFSSRSSAQEGIQGHQHVQRSREKGYVPEYRVSHEVHSEGYEINVSGRIDGYGELVSHGQAAGCYLDEIKTVRVAVSVIPEDVMNSFWLQAKLYGFMLASERGLDSLTLRLCFYHLDEKTETIIEEAFSRQELAEVFVDSLLEIVHRLERQSDWEQVRKASLEGLAFPYGSYRPGQRDMSVAVYRTISKNSQLVMQAPTGIGKTMGTIFPAMLSLRPGEVNRVFYLSAKTSTQQLAERCSTDMIKAGARIRTVTLTAKEKVCFNPGEPCDPDHCGYAKGYYDRLPEAIDALLSENDQFNRPAIEAGAEDFQLCPFELGLDLARFSDLIIGDYNYVFDPVVYLRRFFDGNECDSIGLVDEAHNLVDRGRDMFSASVSKARFLELARDLKKGGVALSREVGRVNRSILAWRKPHQPGFDDVGYAFSVELPTLLLNALQRFCAAAEDVLKQEGSESWRETLLDVYFDALRFVRTSEDYADDYLTLAVKRRDRDIVLKLYCVDPSRKLGEGFKRLASSVCFSATMTPQAYFQQMLGTADECDWYRLSSPFDPANLHVTIAGYVDTSYRARTDSIAEVVEIVRLLIESRKGNFIVFFPSYAYLELVYAAFIETCPDVAVIKQERLMTEEDRQAFLQRFQNSPVCGFAVMGGVFSEGVDLKGKQLIGAAVVGVGLPQLGIDRDLIRDYFEEAGVERGFEYAYQYPGMIRVLQTAGRVIRSETDQGVVCLIDRRYRQGRYLELLPAEWQPQTVNSHEQLRMSLNGFWQQLESDLTGEALQIDTG